ncbi:Protein phosphatase 2C 4 [Elsinoe australis]|uniref:Protein phosphatase 2C 4 n=1 Tax=Elsinoe australis TaxID=40998 RepID=A0A2P7ZU00_9PEZI|nr:Protein phosphatase 2C 4 [Elsinoe australis]
MDYPHYPPPPYTAVDAHTQRAIPSIPQTPSALDLKAERRPKKTTTKKSSRPGSSQKNSHKILGNHASSRSNVSLVQNSIASQSQLCIRPAQIPEEAPPVPQLPNRSLPARCLDTLATDCLREGTEFYNELLRGLDNATSRFNVTLPRTTQPKEIFNNSQETGTTIDHPQGLPSNTYAYYERKTTTNAQQARVVEPNTKISARENVSSKLNQYANSRLPTTLPPFRAYMETHRLLSIAARYSLSVYTPPSPSESSPPSSSLESHIPASFLTGTKAMVLKSIPVDNQSTLVFAIRGSQSFSDWAVNFRPAPSSPASFLDDPDNHCHSGFLSVAKSMVRPVAARLRQLLEQDPGRCNSSLLITGHSAGGAVAALLYAHMLSQNVESELTILTNVFRRVHCVTFGAPPVSLLPLGKPDVERYRKWCFFGVVNQGDLVTRASKEYVASLARLWLAPVPGGRVAEKGRKEDRGQGKKCVRGLVKAVKSMADLKGAAGQVEGQRPVVRPVWNVPPAPLSCAGRLVLLREKPGSVGSGDERIEACAITDDVLRGVVFGDPAMHSMAVYARRVEMLAFRAVTGREN